MHVPDTPLSGLLAVLAAASPGFDWPSIPWVFWVMAGVVIVSLGVYALRDWRERTSARRAYDRALASGASLTDLLPEEIRPHMRRLHQIAATPRSDLPPHQAATGAAQPEREPIRVQLARQLQELSDVLDRLEREAAPRVFSVRDREELAERVRIAADLYTGLGAVLTHGIAVDRTLCQAAVTGQWERMETLADLRTLDGIRELPAAQAALQLTVDQTHELEQIRTGIHAHLRHDDAAGGWWDRLGAHVKGNVPSTDGCASAHPGADAELLLDRLQDMRAQTMQTLHELQAQAGKDALPWQAQSVLMPIGYGPGRRRPSACPLEQLDAAATLRAPTPQDGPSRAQTRQDMKQIRRDLRRARRHVRKTA